MQQQLDGSEVVSYNYTDLNNEIENLEKEEDKNLDFTQRILLKSIKFAIKQKTQLTPIIDVNQLRYYLQDFSLKLEPISVKEKFLSVKE